MKTIDEIYAIVEESSHETAFNRGEVEGLYNTLLTVPKDAVAVEVGVEYGRSTSVFAEFKKEGRLKVFAAVDNWSQVDGPEGYNHVIKQIQKHGWSFDIYKMDSIVAAERFKLDVDIIHIDGDHTYQGVKADCEAWLPKVKFGGYALFDDYGHPGLEGVRKAIDEYIFKIHDWEYMGLHGNKLAVFKKTTAL